MLDGMVGRKVFIGGIPPLCASAGRVLQAIRNTTGLEATECAIKPSKSNGGPCFAFVTFREDAEVRECIRYDRGIQLGGALLNVKEALNQRRNDRQDVEGDFVQLEQGLKLQLGNLTDENEICIYWKANENDEEVETAREVTCEANFSTRRMSFVVSNVEPDTSASTEDVGTAEESALQMLGLMLPRGGRRARSEYKMEVLFRDISGVREILGERSEAFSCRESPRSLGFIIEVRNPPKCFCRSGKEELDIMEGYACHVGSSNGGQHT